MKRAVRSVIRLMAGGMIVIGGMVLGLQFVRYRFHGAEPGVRPVLFGGLLITAGVALFATSSVLAARLTDDFDE